MPFDVVSRNSLPGPEEQLLDQWTFYDFKTIGTGGPISPPQWVGEHARRLRAYTILDAYYRNAARNWMSDEIDEDDKLDRREYGDPLIVVESILSSLLGNDTRILVEGAAEQDAETKLTDLQKELDKWVRKEKLKLKMKECERNAVKLGDGVYVLGWNKDKSRVVVHVWDPGMYFPDLDARNSEEEFADTVHLGYEYEEVNASSKQKERFIRRITWQLLPSEDNMEDSEHPTEGVPHPSVPWDPKSKQNCWFSDKTWLMDNVDNTIEDFIATSPVFVEEHWLDIDFIPIVHIPTTYNAGHYGVSCLAPAMQVFDDLVNNDTDLQKSSSIVGTPPISVSGQLPKDEDGNVESYGPGTVFESVEGSGLQMMDTSRSLDALLKYDEALTGKLSRNTRVPKTLLGDVDPSKVPSGVVLTLSYAPHSSLIREMREIRDDKYGIFLKFVFRLMWKNSQITWEGEEPEIKVVFGSYLPADKQETSGIITSLLSNHGISVETCVAMLMEAGYPIDDAKEEVRRITEQDWDEASKMLDATGDTQAVRDRMGMTGAGPNLALPANPAGPGQQTGNLGSAGPPAPPTPTPLA